MAALVPETVQKVFTAEALRSVAKQSINCHVVPVRLRRAIKHYLQEQEMVHMKRKVFRLSESFSEVKDVNRMLVESTSKELFEDPLKSVMQQSKRWKIKSMYGDVGFTYKDDETIAYIASRMPAVYSALYRVLREVRKRVPDFSPVKVLDFGAGTGSAFWALREVWPRSLEHINVVEPSQPMQRASQSLVQDLRNLPLIHSYRSIQALSQNISKSERQHDLVIASYVLGEIPSLKDRITVVRQLWDLTGDILVLVEPGTPQGSDIISQMRSHILWMEKRKCRKCADASGGASKDKAGSGNGAFVVAPCPHDGPCPLAKTGKYCHFVQRMQRTSSQRAYKRFKGEPLRGFEDEKFSYVVLRRGKRSEEPWPLDGMKLETLKEMHAKRNPEDLVIDYDSAEDHQEMESADVERYERNPALYDSDAAEADALTEFEEDHEDEVTPSAGLGSGWGRIIFSPQRRGKRIEMDVCRSTKRDGSEGIFERLIVTRSKSPTLHNQARKSMWGDLWPF